MFSTGVYADFCGFGQGYCHVSYWSSFSSSTVSTYLPSSLALCFRLHRPGWSPFTTLSTPFFLSLLFTLLCLLFFLSSLDSLRSWLIWTEPARPPFFLPLIKMCLLFLNCFATQSIMKKNVSRSPGHYWWVPRMGRNSCLVLIFKVNLFEAWISSSQACEQDGKQLQALNQLLESVHFSGLFLKGLCSVLSKELYDIEARIHCIQDYLSWCYE